MRAIDLMNQIKHIDTVMVDVSTDAMQSWKEILKKRLGNVETKKEICFKELREESGMNPSEFARYFNITPRTVQRWEAGTRSCPPYLLELMVYKLNNEKAKGEV